MFPAGAELRSDRQAPHRVSDRRRDRTVAHAVSPGDLVRAQAGHGRIAAVEPGRKKPRRVPRPALSFAHARPRPRTAPRLPAARARERRDPARRAGTPVSGGPAALPAVHLAALALRGADRARRASAGAPGRARCSAWPPSCSWSAPALPPTTSASSRAGGRSPAGCVAGGGAESVEELKRGCWPRRRPRAIRWSFSFLGLTLAGWNLVASLLLAALHLRRRPWPRPTPCRPARADHRAPAPEISGACVTATAIRVAVVSRPSRPKIGASHGKHAGHRQARTNTRIVSAPSVSPPR